MTLQERVDAMPYWYHRIELPGGVVTPGWAPLSADSYRLPMDLAGKRVLDVGAWDGFWTFECMKRGAAEVVAIDDFSDCLDSLPGRTAWDTFDLCRDALGYSPEQCRRIEMDVYDAADLGDFDVVLFFGTIYHLRYPLLALDTLAGVCREAIYIESAICDDFSPYAGRGGHAGEMVAEFYPHKQYGDNESNWWAPTLRCLEAMTRAAGFDRVSSWKLAQTPRQLGECRGFVIGERADGKDREETDTDTEACLTKEDLAAAVDSPHRGY